ncbi:MAG: hypothetical protein WKF58_17315 [Ilumatobacteraceae bacterium]
MAAITRSAIGPIAIGDERWIQPEMGIDVAVVVLCVVVLCGRGRIAQFEAGQLGDLDDAGAVQVVEQRIRARLERRAVGDHERSIVQQLAILQRWFVAVGVRPWRDEARHLDAEITSAGDARHDVGPDARGGDDLVRSGLDAAASCVVGGTAAGDEHNGDRSAGEPAATSSESENHS